MVRKFQPGIILDNRLETHEGSSSKMSSISSLGDFETPEQGIPDIPLVDKYNKPIPWETCLTLNDSWGYNEHDKNWKSPELIVHSLVNCVSKNGNLLLNVGPDARGNIPAESIRILLEVGKWIEKIAKVFTATVQACLQSPIGAVTHKKATISMHIGCIQTWVNLMQKASMAIR